MYAKFKTFKKLFQVNIHSVQPKKHMHLLPVYWIQSSTQVRGAYGYNLKTVNPCISFGPAINNFVELRHARFFWLGHIKSRLRFNWYFGCRTEDETAVGLQSSPLLTFLLSASSGIN